MSCEWKDKLEAYVDGELPTQLLAECEQHLRDCPQCTTTLLGRVQMKRAIRAATAARYAPSAALRAKILEMSGGASPWQRWWRLPQFRLAAATVALLVVAAAIWVARPRTADYAGELLDLHVATLASANPVDVLSTDRHTVKPWFEGKLPFSFDLPDLQGSAFRLIGGRVTYLRQSQGAHLLFGIRKHQISVFIFQDRELGRQLQSLPRETRKSGFTIDTWSQDGLFYAAVGDTGPGDIHSLRQLFQATPDSR